MVGGQIIEFFTYFVEDKFRDELTKVRIGSVGMHPCAETNSNFL